MKNAIEQAENQTSGEIVVSVAPFFWGSVDKAARRSFVRLGVQPDTRTQWRAVLHCAVAPVVCGSRGPGYSRESRAGILEQRGRPPHRTLSSRESSRKGLVHGIAEVGRQLMTHFPYDRASDANELPDDVDFGETPVIAIMAGAGDSRNRTGVCRISQRWPWRPECEQGVEPCHAALRCGELQARSTPEQRQAFARNWRHESARKACCRFRHSGRAVRTSTEKTLWSVSPNCFAKRCMRKNRA